MTSQDINVNNVNNNYVTVELLNAHMSRLEAIMERNTALIRADMADLKTELKQDIANVRTELKQEIADVKSELNDKIEAVGRKVDVNSAKIEGLQTNVAKLSDNIEGLRSDVVVVDRKIEVNSAKIDDLYHWNYWIIAVLTIVIVLPRIADGVNALLKSLANGLTMLLSRKAQS